MAKDTPATEAATEPKETKAEAFTRIVNKRLANALQAIRLLEPLANKTNYEFTADQVSRLEKHLIDAVKHVHDVYAGEVKGTEAGPLI